MTRIYTDAERDAAKAALTRITNWLAADEHVCDERSYVIHTDETTEAVHAFIRDHLDAHALPTPTDEEILATYRTDHRSEPTAPGFTTELAISIFNDLNAIWDYEFYRDELSTIAMNMSLCPMHFCDWAACFDDAIDECAAIRIIFPYSHDT